MSLRITPPTSRPSKARNAFPRSFVKTPAWSPNRESLACEMAASKSENRASTTSGANASSEHTFASSGASTRIVGG